MPKKAKKKVAFSQQMFFKSHPLGPYFYVNHETFKRLNVQAAVDKVSLPVGEYKITITIERV